MILRSHKLLLLITCLLVPLVAFAQEEAEQEDPTSALMDAVRDDSVRDVQRLLGEGADASATLDSGLPLIGYAAMKGQADVVAALIEAGADIDAKDKTGATALMYAAQFDHDDIVTALIEAGADVEATDNLGWTPLIRAVIGGNVEAVRALMEAGANVNATDFFDRNAVQIAEGRDEDEIIAVLTGTAEAAESAES